MIIGRRPCAHCGEEIAVTSRNGKQRFCSRRCVAESMALPARTDVETRVLIRSRSTVDLVSGCWVWGGPLNPTNGYGLIYVGSKADGTNRMASVHRVSYEAFVGPIPDGLTIDHVWARGCTHKLCVNPTHLEAVTGKVNILRGGSPWAENARKTHCARGGHEYTPENTLRDKHGRRRCRTCAREWAAINNAKRSEQRRVARAVA